eukprot:TRINITY_DN15809_c0_g1_i1.p1 TRINITY_DN15809_c0_g1~~TRINITY_DN15809_c0_g1_i1.p1  ORF type:complete len:115 (-),score=3.31 TRINITY_DN15809_c0_g1_i1:61-405(-)
MFLSRACILLMKPDGLYILHTPFILVYTFDEKLKALFLVFFLQCFELRLLFFVFLLIYRIKEKESIYESLNFQIKGVYKVELQYNFDELSLSLNSNNKFFSFQLNQDKFKQNLL